MPCKMRPGIMGELFHITLEFKEKAREEVFLVALLLIIIKNNSITTQPGSVPWISNEVCMLFPKTVPSLLRLDKVICKLQGLKYIVVDWLFL